jgi:LPXTG-motif cell wall-anchored protein
VTLSDSMRSSWLFLAGLAAVSLLLVLAPRRRNTYRDEWLVES